MLCSVDPTERTVVPEASLVCEALAKPENTARSSLPHTWWCLLAPSVRQPASSVCAPHQRGRAPSTRPGSCHFQSGGVRLIHASGSEQADLCALSWRLSRSRDGAPWRRALPLRCDTQPFAHAQAPLQFFWVCRCLQGSHLTLHVSCGLRSFRPYRPLKGLDTWSSPGP